MLRDLHFQWFCHYCEVIITDHICSVVISLHWNLIRIIMATFKKITVMVFRVHLRAYFLFELEYSYSSGITLWQANSQILNMNKIYQTIWASKGHRHTLHISIHTDIAHSKNHSFVFRKAENMQLCQDFETDFLHACRIFSCKVNVKVIMGWKIQCTHFCPFLILHIYGKTNVTALKSISCSFHKMEEFGKSPFLQWVFHEDLKASGSARLFYWVLILSTANKDSMSPTEVSFM